MVVDVALYTLVHQPRRLKLPAQPIPRYASIEDITRCLFDERLNEYYFRRVARASYYPAARVLLNLARERGLRLGLGLSLAFVRQAERWEPELLDLFRELAEEESVELIGVDPYHSLHCLIDLPAFALRMRWMADEIERMFGKRPVVTDTTGMCMSASIYNALDTAGFRGAFIDSNPRLMEWRSSNYLYRYGDEQPGPFEIKLPARARRSTAKNAERDCLGPPYTSETPGEDGLFLLARHQQLSDDVALRFSNHAWSGYPLYASDYAGWIKHAEGDFVLLNWDFECFGERHARDTGIFEFIQALPDELENQGIELRTPGELIERYAGERAHHLPLPVYPTVWADVLGLDNALSHAPQRDLLQLMRDVYNLARLTENPELLDLSIWLMQADSLRFLRWPDFQIATAVTPRDWWHLSPADFLREQKQIYFNLLSALEPYLPMRVLRQASRKPKAPAKTTRRKSAAEKQEAGAVARRK